MSEELAAKQNLKIGQKVMYLHTYIRDYVCPEIVIIKDVTTNYNDEIVILTEEHDGYLNLSDILTKTQIYEMFNPKDYENNYDGIWNPAHKLAELAVESNWDSIRLIKLLVDKIGVVMTMDLVKEAIEKLKKNYGKKK